MLLTFCQILIFYHIIHTFSLKRISFIYIYILISGKNMHKGLISLLSFQPIEYLKPGLQKETH